MAESIFNTIKSHISLVEVVNYYTTLKQAGLYWKGRCPFHQEKTGSFTVSPHINIFYCFGCHESGDVISFIAKIENCSQLQAAHQLAEKYNISITKLVPSIDNSKSKKMYAQARANKGKEKETRRRRKDKGELQKNGILWNRLGGCNPTITIF